MEGQFKPKPGQIDYTNICWAPVINCILKYKDNILLLRRSEKLNFYPGYWSGVSGFLDDNKPLEQKVRDEIKEELGLEGEEIISIRPAPIFHQKEHAYKKVWIIHPVLVEVATDKITLDWEAQEYRWVSPREALKFDSLPGFDKVLRRTVLTRSLLSPLVPRGRLGRAVAIIILGLTAFLVVSIRL